MTSTAVASDLPPRAAPPRGSRPGERRPGLGLEELAARVPGAALVRATGEVRVSGMHQDSRAVEPGDLFAARAGARTDGARHVDEAVRRGAVALLCARGFESAHSLPHVEVDDVRRAIPDAANAVYGDPTASLEVVGITGTNGKTTTASLVRAAASAAGVRMGVVGTLGVALDGPTRPTAHTSPEADELMRIARDLLDRGASHLVMEVSSIALAAYRVEGVRFDVAVFTNLSQDHLDFHGSMAAYGEAKRRLFTDFAVRGAVVNVDDPFGAELADALAGRPGLIRTSRRPGASPGDVELLATDVTLTERGQRIRVRSAQGDLEIDSPLLGAHNVENVLSALGACAALGLELSDVVRGLSLDIVVPGRLERCDDPLRDDVVVLVDYAHTPDALRRVLTSVRASTRGRVHCVFGCGGDRDADKRPLMGRAAGELADRCIVTNDNPRSESPDRIAAQIVAGLHAVSAAYDVELDRRAAIELAVLSSAPGDTIVLAGKGHEPYQIIGAETLSFDDRVVAREVLAARRGEGPSQ